MSTPDTDVTIEDLLAEEAFVRRLALPLVRSSAHLDDVVQETWMRALRGGPRAKSTLRGWLRSVVSSVVSGMYREEARRHTREVRSARAESIPSTDSVVERLRVQRAVVDRVVALDEPYRTVILLRFYENLPPREIAGHLGIPVATVRTRLYRAIERLRGELAGGDSGPETSRDWLPSIGAFFLAGAGAAGSAAATTSSASVATVGGVKGAATSSSGLLLAVAPAKAAAAGIVAIATVVVLLLVLFRGPGFVPTEDAIPSIERDDAGRRGLPEYAPDSEPSAKETPVESAAGVTADPDAAFGGLVVRTVFADDGSPAGGVGIRLDSPTGSDPRVEVRESVTDRDGIARFDSLPAARVSARTHQYGNAEAVVRAGRTVDVEIAVERGVDVRGLVVDSFGDPVGGATVRVSSPGVLIPPFDIATSDVDGRFFVRCLGSIHALGAVTREHTASKLLPTNGLQANEDGTRFARLVLGSAAPRVTGLVRDPDGEPVAGAEVALDLADRTPSERTADGSWAYAPPACRAVTGSSGRFEIFGAREGRSLFRITASGWAPATGAIDVRADVGAYIDVSLSVGGVIEGRCTDETGQPMPEVRVRATRHSRLWPFWITEEARTDANGDYRIDGLSAARYEMEAEGDGELTVSGRVELIDEETIRWDPVLSTDVPRIRARVVDERGDPLREWWVHVTESMPSNGPAETAAEFTDAEGRVRIPVRERGEYRVRIHESFPDFPLAGRWSAIPDEAELTIQVLDAAVPSGGVRGRIVDVAGNPVIEAEVSLYQEDGEYPAPKTTRPDVSTGAFSLDRLPSGRYVVLASAPRRPPVESEVFDLTAGEEVDVGDLIFARAGRVSIRADLSRFGEEATGLRLNFAPRGEETLRSLARPDPTTWITPYLEPGPYVLQVHGSRAAAERIEFEIEADSDRFLEIAPSVGRPVSLRFFSRTPHSGSGGLQVIVRESGGVVRYDAGARRPRSGEAVDGATQLLDLALPPGAYTVEAMLGSGRSVSRSIRVLEADPAGAAIRFDVDLD